MRKLDAVLNRQSKRDMAGNPSRAEAGKTAGNCSDSLAESAAEHKLVAFRMRAAVDAGRLLAWSVSQLMVTAVPFHKFLHPDFDGSIGPEACSGLQGGDISAGRFDITGLHRQEAFFGGTPD